MSVGRTNAAGALLASGLVLVAGGSIDDTNALATTELYNPATGTWSAGAVHGRPRAWITP